MTDLNPGLSAAAPPPEEMPLPGQLGLLEQDTRATPPTGQSRQRFLLWGAVAAAVLFVALGATAGYLAWTNKSRADDWQARAAALQMDSDRLQAALDARTKSLNERTDEVNTLAVKVADAEEAIQRSEGDVKRLERRQRQLAAEKADVEDARAALAVQTAAIQDLAQRYIGCNAELTQLLQYVADDNDDAVNAIAGQVVAQCTAAASALRSYQTHYE